MAKVKDGIFLGDGASSQDLDFKHSNKIDYMINCAGLQLPNLWAEYGTQYLTFGWRDDEHCNLFNLTEDKSYAVEQIVNFIDEALERGVSVLIHSLKGTGRAAACCLAYFMAKHSWSLDKSIHFIQSKRIELDPNQSFCVQLRTLDRSLRSTSLQQYDHLPERARQNILAVVNTRLHNWTSSSLEFLQQYHADHTQLVQLLDEERVLVNSVLNSRPSASPSRLREGTDHNYEHIATRLRWIDEYTNENLASTSHDNNCFSTHTGQKRKSNLTSILKKTRSDANSYVLNEANIKRPRPHALQRPESIDKNHPMQTPPRKPRKRQYNPHDWQQIRHNESPPKPRKFAESFGFEDAAALLANQFDACNIYQSEHEHRTARRPSSANTKNQYSARNRCWSLERPGRKIYDATAVYKPSTRHQRPASANFKSGQRKNLRASYPTHIRAPAGFSY